MFEKIVYRPHSIRMPFDIGQVMESMFFYQNTIVHVGRLEIIALAQAMDNDTIIEFLNRPEITLEYRPAHPGILPWNENESGQAREFGVQSFGLAKLDLQKIVYEATLQASGDSKRAKDLSNRMVDFLKVQEFPKNFGDTLISELSNDVFRNQVILESIGYNFPRHGLSLNQIQSTLTQTGVHPIGEPLFRLDTNINLGEYKLTMDEIFMNAIVGTTNIQAAAEANSEIVLPELQSSILRTKINHLINQTVKSREKIEGFNEHVYVDTIDLKEAINRQKNTKAFLQLLDKAAKNKNWMHELPNDANLLNEYVRACGAGSWITDPRAKGIRLFIFTGTGLILGTAIGEGLVSIAAGMGLTTFDTFVLDHLFKKWKPNQFIENSLVPTIKKTASM